MAAETVELGTIYLVDLVGSTQMATSVGPVRWDEMREQFFGLLREAIDASGGREFKKADNHNWTTLNPYFRVNTSSAACTDKTGYPQEQRVRASACQRRSWRQESDR
jgi:class 3 adenylate cyclase